MHSLLLLLSLLIPPSSHVAVSLCPDSCGSIPIRYPFGLRPGCGARQFLNTLNCTTNTPPQLLFHTPSGDYIVQSINYRESTITIYDPLMSTCNNPNNINTPHDFSLSDPQYLTIVPSPDTFFALLNCSPDSPVLHRLSRLCAPSLSAHACSELYSCPSFHAKSDTNLTTPASPPTGSSSCCFTRYDTLRYMTMEILDCTGLAFLYGMDRAKGIPATDWSYGIKLVYGVPDVGCGACGASGGSCGFDVETGGALCICSAAVNSTTTCGGAGDFESNAAMVGTTGILLRASSMVGFGAILNYFVIQF